MKVGDKLYCHTDCISTGGSFVGFYILRKGSYYTIVEDVNNKYIVIERENKQTHCFSYKIYKEWLFTKSDLIKQERKEKIKTLNEKSF